MQVFLDTNIVLEGRLLADLPWAQLGASGPLLVYFVPRVLSEIDGKKRDGRLGEKARAFNRWISPLATSDAELLICDTPRVEARLANPRKIDWDALPDFDPSEADARVVAEMFNTPDLDPTQTVLVSQDINPLNMARRLGLRVHHVGADWLAPKEPSPSDKEIARLKQKLREHEVSEPTLEIEIDASLDPIDVVRIQRVDEAARYTYQRTLERAAGRHRTPDPCGLGAMTDYSFENRLKDFKNTALPHYIENFERYLGLSLSQTSFRMQVSNTGSLRADRLMIRISGEGLLLHSKVLTLTPHGPMAPSPRPGSGLVIPPAFRPPRPIGAHEVHFARKPVAGGQLIEAHCEDFRHGGTWSFDGFAALDPTFDGPAVIEVELTAANKKGALSSSFTFKKHVLDLSFEDVAESETLKFKRPPNLEDQARALYEQEAWDRLDIRWLGAES